MLWPTSAILTVQCMLCSTVVCVVYVKCPWHHVFDFVCCSVQLPTTPTMDDFCFLSYHLRTDSSCSSLVITDEDGTVRRPRARSLRSVSLSISLSFLHLSPHFSPFPSLPNSILLFTWCLHLSTNTHFMVNTVLSVHVVRYWWTWTPLTISSRTSIPRPKKKWKKNSRCAVHATDCMQMHVHVHVHVDDHSALQ